MYTVKTLGGGSGGGDSSSDYFMTSSFITRVMNTVILLAAWVVAVIAIDNNNLASTQVQIVRMAFLIIAVIAFVECVAILIICLSSYACNILIGIFIAVDAFLGLFLVAVSTAAITREMLIQKGSINATSYRSGTFTAAAVLGFISTVLYIELIILYIKYIIVQMNE